MSAAVLVMETHLCVTMWWKKHIQYVHAGRRRNVLGELSQEKSTPA
jgi:hypothetical protein